MSMEEEQAKRAEALKAKIAARNKERKARRAAGGTSAVAEATRAAKSNGAGGNGQTAPAKSASKEEKVGAAPKKKAAKKPAKKAAAKSKSQKRRVDVTKKGKAKKAAPAKKTTKRASKANGTRTMDRDPETGLRPIEDKIISLCKKSKKAMQIRAIAESLFGVNEVKKADEGKDNGLIRQIRNNVRRPVELGILDRPETGHIRYAGPDSLGKAASKKAKAAAKKATGKRA